MVLARKYVEHPCGRASGVTTDDSRISAARKAIDTMRSLGMCTKQAERMLADAIVRGVK